MLRLLIVDDEPLICQGIRDLLDEMGEVEIVGECESGFDAIQAIEEHRPDLVLLDVQMPDGTGLDVVRRIGPERMPMVVFVTAYDEYAVTAFEMNAVDYLLKPFDGERLRQTMERARRSLMQRDQAALTCQLQALLRNSHSPLPPRLAVRNGSRYDFVQVDSIDWIESANNYVELHCSGRVHILRETLTGLERKLDPEMFVRVHRCRIVNVSRIAAVHTEFSGTYELEMRTGDRLTTGRQFRNVIHYLIASQLK